MKLSEMDNLDILIGVVHLMGMAFNTTYGLIFQKSWFDYVYLWGFYAVILHWTFFNNECGVTYYVKKCKNEEYVAGDSIEDNEVQPLLHLSDHNYNIFIRLNLVLVVINVYVVSLRNHISPILCSVIFGLAIIHMLTRSLERTYFLWFQECIKYMLIVLGVVCLWLFNQRFRFI